MILSSADRLVVLTLDQIGLLRNLLGSYIIYYRKKGDFERSKLYEALLRELQFRH